MDAVQLQQSNEPFWTELHIGEFSAILLQKRMDSCYFSASQMENQLPNHIEQVNRRIDKALAANRRSEILVFTMAAFIFLSGILILVLGYRYKNLYLRTGAALFPTLLYWPIRKIIRLRQVNLILQTFPVIVSILPMKECAKELKKMLEYLRKVKT